MKTLKILAVYVLLFLAIYFAAVLIFPKINDIQGGSGDPFQY